MDAEQPAAAAAAAHPHAAAYHVDGGDDDAALLQMQLHHAELAALAGHFPAQNGSEEELEEFESGQVGAAPQPGKRKRTEPEEKKWCVEPPLESRRTLTLAEF